MVDIVCFIGDMEVYEIGIVWNIVFVIVFFCFFNIDVVGDCYFNG